jgi:hypothetical protein
VPSWNLRVCHRGGNDDALIAATRSFEIEKIFTAIPVLKTNGFSYAKPNRNIPMMYGYAPGSTDG